MVNDHVLLAQAWAEYQERRRPQLISRSWRVADLRADLELYRDSIAASVLTVLRGRVSNVTFRKDPQLRAALARLRDSAWRPRVGMDAQVLLSELDQLERLAAIAQQIQAIQAPIGDASDRSGPRPYSRREGQRAPAPRQIGRYTFTDTQLRRKYGSGAMNHAGAFGVAGGDTLANREAWAEAMRRVISAPDTRLVAGTYRAQPAAFFVARSWPRMVMVRPGGRFASAWKLSRTQVDMVRTRGQL